MSVHLAKSNGSFSSMSGIWFSRLQWRLLNLYVRDCYILENCADSTRHVTFLGGMGTTRPLKSRETHSGSHAASQFCISADFALVPNSSLWFPLVPLGFKCSKRATTNGLILRPHWAHARCTLFGRVSPVGSPAVEFNSLFSSKSGTRQKYFSHPSLVISF